MSTAAEAREIVLGGQRVSYLLRRSARKTLGLRIDHRGLIVGVPLRARLGDAEAFMRSHAAWIIEKLDARARSPQAVTPRFQADGGAVLPYLGQPCRLRLGQGNNQIRWHEAGDVPTLELALRAGAEPRLLLLKALQQRALLLFVNRVEEFCARLGRPAPPVGLSNARTRWGSCSSRSGIRLHWRLIHLPLSLIDYVVAHEVAHLIEMNHSPRFWSVVESLYPGHMAARRALRDAAAALPLI